MTHSTFHSYASHNTGPDLVIILAANANSAIARSTQQWIDALHDGTQSLARGAVHLIIPPHDATIEAVQKALQQIKANADNARQPAHTVVICLTTHTICPSQFMEAALAAHVTSAHVQKIADDNPRIAQQLIRKKLQLLGMNAISTEPKQQQQPKESPTALAA